MKPRIAAVTLLAVFAAGPAQAECVGTHCYDGLVRAFAIGCYGVTGFIALIFVVLRRWEAAGILIGTMAFVAFGLPLWHRVSSDWAMARMEKREVWALETDPFQGTPVLLSPMGEHSCAYSVCNSIVKAAGDKGILSLSFAAIKALDPDGPTQLASLPLERWVFASGGFVKATPLTSEETAELAPRIDRLIVAGGAGEWSKRDTTETLFASNPALEGLPQDQVIKFAAAPLEVPGILNPAEMKFDVLDLYLVRETVPAPFWIRIPYALANPLSEQAEAMIRTEICSGRSPVIEDKCMEPFR